MKILIACIPNPKNKYLTDLVTGLSTFSEITWDFEEFWSCKNDYDIVHVHWPEYLSFEVESYLQSNDDFTPELWSSIESSLKYWKQNSTIVYTRHVRAPHFRDDEVFKRLYGLVFKYCTGMSHFAEFSINQYKSYFPDIDIPLHQVIPQHKHISLADNSSKNSARKQLGISKTAKVLLCFGLIRENEKDIIRAAFNSIPSKEKVLLAPKWKINRRKINYIRLREMVFNFEVWLASFNKKWRVYLGFIKEEDVHLYCNAADVLFIPRTNELFSGNISLAFTFGLVVLGKDDSNIGEILREHENPTFEVGNLASLQKGVRDAFQRSQEGLGQINKNVANTTWSIESITNHYNKFFLEAIQLSKIAGSIN